MAAKAVGAPHDNGHCAEIADGTPSSASRHTAKAVGRRLDKGYFAEKAVGTPCDDSFFHK